MRDIAGRGGSDSGVSGADFDPCLQVIDVVETAQREVESNVNLGLVCDHLVSMLYRALSGRVAVV